jgi:hypothetical protein
MSTICDRYWFRFSTISSGCRLSQNAVKPRMSENNIVSSWLKPRSDISSFSERDRAASRPTYFSIAVCRKVPRRSARNARCVCAATRPIADARPIWNVGSTVPFTNAVYEMPNSRHRQARKAPEDAPGRRIEDARTVNAAESSRPDQATHSGAHFR